jgi:hypothetical protein
MSNKMTALIAAKRLKALSGGSAKDIGQSLASGAITANEAIEKLRLIGAVEYALYSLSLQRASKKSAIKEFDRQSLNGSDNDLLDGPLVSGTPGDEADEVEVDQGDPRTAFRSSDDF